MNKWDIMFNNVALINFGLSMVNAFIATHTGKIGYGVFSIIHAIIFIFGYNQVKEKP